MGEDGAAAGSSGDAALGLYFAHGTEATLVVRLRGDGQFEHVAINLAAQRLFGLTAAAAIGRTPHDVLPPETAYAHEKSYRLAITRAPESVTEQRTLAYPSGSIRAETTTKAMSDAALGDAASGEMRVISGTRDLSAREQVQARMQHSECMDVIAQLTGGVAHDVNNLLTVVIGNLALLRRRLGAADARTGRYLGSIEAASQRGTKLTTSLLSFSRRQTLRIERLDVARRVLLSEPALRQALGRDIGLTVTVGPDLAPASADAAHFDIALLHLVSNARDAIAEGADGADGVGSAGELRGEVAVSVRRATLGERELAGNDDAFAGDFVAVRVQDNGAGMPESVRARAFEPFFTTKDVGRGPGLGLSHVFGFVRQLGGHVTLDSMAGHGTAATMFLPLASGAAAVAAAAVVDAGAAGATVLFVEDDPTILDITAEILADAGFDVVTASSAREALALLRAGQPVDLLFTDVVMPGGATGLDLALAASELRPGLRVLLTSGYPGPALNRFGPITEFPILAKPFSRDALLDRIGAMLRPD